MKLEGAFFKRLSYQHLGVYCNTKNERTLYPTQRTRPASTDLIQRSIVTFTEALKECVIQKHPDHSVVRVLGRLAWV